MQDTVSLLMVEDSPALSEMYKAYLEGLPYQVISVNSLGGAKMAYAAAKPDIVLLDIELPDGNGLDFLAELAGSPESAEVVVMTAHGTSTMAVDAIEAGAFDFLTKPFDANRLRVTLDNACGRITLANRANRLNELERTTYGRFIGSSLPMQAVYKTIDSLAASDASAFIVGESGTGKELAAEAIHQHSRRADGQLVTINCGAIPAGLMESELFGHVKGSFTSASSSREGAAHLADGGTLFLDEICEMSLELQKKLLRFIQTGRFRKVGSDKEVQVDVRFVCATNRDPLEEVQNGRFREDLFYRLHVVPLRMPALRERGDDILMIARQFLSTYCQRDGKAFSAFSVEAEAALSRYLWPGNVRQLQNVIQQVVVLHEGETVTATMLPESVRGGHIENIETTENSKAPSLSPHIQRRLEIQPLWLVEKDAIEQAIETCEGNINKAAGLLEVAPSTLYRKLQSWKNIGA